MRSSHRRAITWTLVALGILIVGLGAVLAATYPWSTNAAQAGPGFWHGGGYGGRFGHHPGFFGGGLFFGVIVILIVSLIATRRRHWRYDGHDERIDAEDILRRTFAEGRITEEEYQGRLRALRK